LTSCSGTSIRSSRAVDGALRIIAELRRKYEVSVAEAGHLQLHRRALIGWPWWRPTPEHVQRVLESCERLVAGRTELQLLSRDIGWSARTTEVLYSLFVVS